MPFELSFRPLSHKQLTERADRAAEMIGNDEQRSVLAIEGLRDCKALIRLTCRKVALTFEDICVPSGIPVSVENFTDSLNAGLDQI